MTTTALRPIRSRAAVAAVIAAALVALTAPGAAAQQVIDSYIAYIGDADLRNSRGARLRDAAAILRQDRANVWRYGVSQPGDELDAFFDDIGNCGAMERLLGAGGVSPADARLIVDGGVTVRVDVYGSGSVGRAVEAYVVGW